MALYAGSLAHQQLLARIGLALIIGGAAGNLIDRMVVGSVVDFVDVYWRTYHFWAFNVADSAITVGVAIMILDMLGVGTHASKILFDLGPITVYTYGVLLAAAYLLGLKLAMVRAQARGLDSARVLDLGIYIIISALIGAKLLLLVTDFRTFVERPVGAAHAGAIGRRVLRRADSRRVGRALVHPQDRPAAVDDVRRVRARHRARPRRRPVRLLLRRLLLRQADRRAVGDHVHQSRMRRRTSARRSNVPLHPTQLYEAGAEALILGAPARHRTARPAVSGPHVLALHAALRDLALHHRDLPRTTRAARS